MSTAVKVVSSSVEREEALNAKFVADAANVDESNVVAAVEEEEEEKDSNAASGYVVLCSSQEEAQNLREKLQGEKQRIFVILFAVQDTDKPSVCYLRVGGLLLFFSEEFRTS